MLIVLLFETFYCKREGLNLALLVGEVWQGVLYCFSLLAMGRAAYGEKYGSYKLIQEQYLPTKETQQLRYRSKNLRSRREKYKENPVKVRMVL